MAFRFTVFDITKFYKKILFASVYELIICVLF